MLFRSEDTIDLAQIKALWDAQETIGSLNRRSQVYQHLSAYHDRAVQTALTVIDQEYARANLELYVAELRAVKLVVDGVRLQQLGLPPGPRLGQLLIELREAVLDGAITTPAEQEDFARHFIARQGTES